MVRKLQKKNKKKNNSLSTSGVTNSYPKDKKKYTHQHTNSIRCPPLIPLIIPTACVCVSVYATACLTFLLTPQKAVICVAPSAQTHFVIRPICVLLYRSVVCVSVSAGGRSPFQSTSQWLYPPCPTLPHQPYNTRTHFKHGAPVTMAPEHKPRSKTADTEKALLVL